MALMSIAHTKKYVMPWAKKLVSEPNMEDHTNYNDCILHCSYTSCS